MKYTKVFGSWRDAEGRVLHEARILEATDRGVAFSVRREGEDRDEVWRMSWHPLRVAAHEIPRFYPDVLATALAHWRHWRELRARGCGEHRPIRATPPLPYTGGVSRYENRAAHGGYRERQECHCGMIRDVLVNGQAVEWGPWHVPAEPPATEV